MTTVPREITILSPQAPDGLDLASAAHAVDESYGVRPIDGATAHQVFARGGRALLTVYGAQELNTSGEIERLLTDPPEVRLPVFWSMPSRRSVRTAKPVCRSRSGWLSLWTPSASSKTTERPRTVRPPTDGASRMHERRRARQPGASRPRALARLGATSQHGLLDLGDRLGHLDAARARLGAVEGRAAPPHALLVVEDVEALARRPRRGSRR